MRTIQEYVEQVKEKYEFDNPVTGITIRECVDLIIDQAFFNDEILYQTVEPLKSKVFKIISNE